MTIVKPAILETMIDKADKALIPFTALLELTRRCNLNCRHCYQVVESNRPELPTRRINRLIGELRRAGCLFLTITGGEPLLHPDFLPILRQASAAPLALMLFTNGQLVTETLARQLARLNIVEVSLSLYGATAATHDRLTRRPGSFRRTLKAVCLLKKAGLNVRFKYLLMNENIAEYPQMQALARKSDVLYDIDPLVTPCDNGDSTPTRLRLSDESLRTLYRSLTRKAQVTKTESPSGACSFGRSHCAINAYGDVYPCIQLPVAAGNVRRSSFRDIWQNSGWLKEVRAFSHRKIPACRKCARADSCRRCAGLNYVGTGSIYRADPEACRQARVISHT